MNTKTFKLTVTKNRKNPSEGKISIEGDLTLKNIKEIKEKLLNSTKTYKSLNIQVKKVDNLDITFIQLLIAVKKSFKAVSINTEIPEHAEGIINNSGLQEYLNTNIIAN
ncbi:STAS domain-containing protein [Bacteroidota bacterium]